MLSCAHEEKQEYLEDRSSGCHKLPPKHAWKMSATSAGSTGCTEAALELKGTLSLTISSSTLDNFETEAPKPHDWSMMNLGY